MDSPKVSVITPTYNAENVIATCLESVAKQTYRPVEHMIVDGLSQDRTLDIVKDFASRHEHIQYITEKDQGIYDAMNKGIKQASGEWLYFLGSDDVLYSNEVLSQVFLQQELLTYDIIYGDVYSIRHGSLYDGVFDGEKIVRKNICHQAIFFHKSVFSKKGTFNLRYKTYADWDYNLRWFLDKDIRKKYVPLTIARYMDGGYSSTQTDAAFKEDRFSLALRYDTGVLPHGWKAHLIKAMMRHAVRKKSVLQFFKYLLPYVKAKIQKTLHR